MHDLKQRSANQDLSPEQDGLLRELTQLEDLLGNISPGPGKGTRMPEKGSFSITGPAQDPPISIPKRKSQATPIVTGKAIDPPISIPRKPTGGGSR